MKWLQHTDPGLGKWLARHIIGRAWQLKEREKEVEIYWLPGHINIEGNKKADKAAKKAMEKSGTQRYPERFTSLHHVGCIISERKSK